MAYWLDHDDPRLAELAYEIDALRQEMSDAEALREQEADDAVTARLQGEFAEIEGALGRELEDVEVAALAARAEHTLDAEGMPSLVAAFDEMQEPLEDGYEDQVHGQISALEEASARELTPAEGDELANLAREYVDEDGEPNVYRAWTEKYGEIPDDSTPYGRQQQIANVIDGEQKFEKEMEEVLGDLNEDTEEKPWPKFQSSKDRLEYLAREVEAAGEEEAAERAAEDANIDARLTEDQG